MTVVDCSILAAGPPCVALCSFRQALHIPVLSNVNYIKYLLVEISSKYSNKGNFNDLLCIAFTRLSS